MTSIADVVDKDWSLKKMIDEKRLIEEIVNTPTEESGYNPVYLSGCATRQLEILDIIENQPKVGEWIPCSERLPSEEESLYYDDDYDCIVNQEFIVTIEGAEESTVLYYDAIIDVWSDEHGNVYDVIAWMPLPSAYKGE